ncbi:protein SRC2 homolog [Ricinus communis]|uniref:C2 domain-containing protein n=1 Tax=Ricinus communis TaxID=3988 RepID=B9RG27_RICCO|nr:protein SRC2 homolog [Ricinus communis]EEF50148.1 conserved hypothetical protein [Ricinus communis]|eukprot:XP_015570604.1 protein SRC2 homolog [Ricinus communis]
MEWSSLELKLISCRDLRAFNLFQKLSVYAVVSSFNDELKKKDAEDRQKTPVDTQGGRHPEWNHSMHFDLEPVSLADHLFLKFKLRCAGVIFGKRTIGEVRVPFKDLIDEYSGTVRFMSYQVRSGDGKPSGVLNFSYRLKGKSKEKEDDCPCATGESEKVKEEADDVQPQPRLYPSLEDIHSPLPSHYPVQESPLGLAVDHRHPSPATYYCWYTSETAGYGYSVGAAGWAN